MPGIAGYTINENQTSKNALKPSLDLITYYDWYVEDDIFLDEIIICSRVHLGAVGDLKSPFQKGGIYAWVEGEFYNQNDSRSHSEYLIHAYKNEVLESELARLDGYFSAVLYDSIQKRILLISDRLGFKNMYYCSKNNVFSWNSELKGFIGFPYFNLKIEKEAIPCFLQLGSLVGDLTWFEDVKLMDAATILTYDLDAKKIVEKKRYWKWSNIKKQKIEYKEAVERLAELIKKSVQKRNQVYLGSNFKLPPKLGITLSGGLDSRAIIAAADNPQKLHAITYGSVDCEDIKIAQEVARVAGLKHTVLDLNKENWLEKRLESVWRADGMSALNHLHFGVHQEKIKNYFDINLNGILGEIAIGGALMKRPNQRMKAKIARKTFGEFADFVPVNDSFYDFPSEDVFWIDTRSRRSVHAGSVEFSKNIEQRNPFADNELLEFVFSLPGDYRRYSKIYIHALLKLNPRLLESIPWQRTGIPPAQIRKTIFYKKFKIPQIIERLGFASNKHFVDYPNWFRRENAATLFSEILNPKNAIYPEYLNEDFKKKYLEPHLNNKGNFVEEIGRAVSLEYWLKKIFEYQ